MQTQAKQGTKQPALLFQSYSGFLGCCFASASTPQLTPPACTQFLKKSSVHNGDLRKLYGASWKDSFKYQTVQKLFTFQTLLVGPSRWTENEEMDFEMWRKLFISGRHPYKQNKKETLRTNRRKTQKQQNCNYLP